MKLLIVDDNAMNRRLPILMLQAENDIVCREASNGQQALQALRDDCFDVVLLDISMPDMSGIEVCQLASSLGLPSLPRFIAYTAHAMVDEIDSFLRQGFDAVLVKPVSRDAVMNVLGRAALCH